MPMSGVYGTCIPTPSTHQCRVAGDLERHQPKHHSSDATLPARCRCFAAEISLDPPTLGVRFPGMPTGVGKYPILGILDITL